MFGSSVVALTDNVWFDSPAPAWMPVRVTICGPEFSLTRSSAIGSSVGGSFMGLTVSAKLSLADAPSGSVTVMVMTADPNASGCGVMVTMRFESSPPKTIPVSSTSAGLEEVPVSVSEAAADSTSPTIKGIGPVDESSLVLCAPMSEMTGGSFTPSTVRRNVVELVALPSVTRTVIVAVPVLFVAGVMTSARLEPLPPTRMAAFGTRAWSLDVAVTTRFPAAVSTSLTIKGTSIGASSVVVRSLMPERVGTSFTGVTVSVNVKLEEPNAVSVTVRVTAASPL